MTRQSKKDKNEFFFFKILHFEGFDQHFPWQVGYISTSVSSVAFSIAGPKSLGVRDLEAQSSLFCLLLRLFHMVDHFGSGCLSIHTGLVVFDQLIFTWHLVICNMVGQIWPCLPARRLLHVDKWKSKKRGIKKLPLGAPTDILQKVIIFRHSKLPQLVFFRKCLRESYHFSWLTRGPDWTSWESDIFSSNMMERAVKGS